MIVLVAAVIGIAAGAGLVVLVGWIASSRAVTTYLANRTARTGDDSHHAGSDGMDAGAGDGD